MLTRLTTSLLATLAMLVVLSAGGCGPSQPQAQTHANPEKGFTITYPGTWHESTYGHGADVEIMPIDEDDPNVFRDNVLVRVESLRDPLTAEEYAGIKIAKGATIMPDYKEIEKGAGTLGGIEARRLVYSYTHGETPVTSIAYFAVSGRHGYMVLGSAVSNRFEEFKPTLEGIIATFRLTQAPAAPEQK